MVPHLWIQPIIDSVVLWCLFLGKKFNMKVDLCNFLFVSLSPSPSLSPFATLTMWMLAYLVLSHSSLKLSLLFKNYFFFFLLWLDVFLWLVFKSTDCSASSSLLLKPFSVILVEKLYYLALWLLFDFMFSISLLKLFPYLSILLLSSVSILMTITFNFL